MQDDCDASDIWPYFRKQAEPLTRHTFLEKGEPGDGAAGIGEAFDQATADWVAEHGGDDWDSTGLLQQCLCFRGALSQKHVRFETNQLRGSCPYPTGISYRQAVIDPQVASHCPS